MFLSTPLAVLALAGVSLAQRPFPVTGVPVSPGAPVPLRQNINTLASSGPQWDLYVQAVYTMQKANSDDPLSYFQIAGIHGMPYIEWNNTGGQKGNQWMGYCPHGEDIFITWHRPYVLLYEQALVRTAQQIAATYPPQYRNQYQQAATSLRAPFWDWAAESQVPQVTVPATLEINVPNGNGLKKVGYTNPLRTFYFPHTALQGKYGEFRSDGQDHTIRCPSPNENYPNSANANLGARPYKSWLYDVMAHSTDFSDFASTGGPGINIEQIHNAIHWDGACGNQFLEPETSGFDPLFMLHHANVDRLWAYWEVIKPQSSVFTRSYKGQSRFATPDGTTITPQSPLQPFFQANGQFHTSLSVQSIQGMGYSYQGLEYWQKSPAQMQSDTTKLINQLYGSGPTKKRSTSQQRRSMARTRFFVKVSVDVTELERPAEVNIYVGGQKAGSMVIMMLPATGTVNGGFTVDEAIQAAQRDSGARNAVSAFQANVQAEIVKRDGTIIPLSSVPSLNITLETVDVTPPVSSDQLPKFGNRQHHAAKASAWPNKGRHHN